MKAKQGCLFSAVSLLLLCGLVGLALLGVQFLRQRQEHARWEYLPPVVRITEPQSGVSAPVGSYLFAVSTITFPPQNPVQTVEWWLNGALVESHPLQSGAGVSQAYDSYNLLIPTEGTHMLLARAINTRGVIGQSQPRTFQGVAKGEAFYAVTVNEGETLESLAASYGSDAATLQTLNPGLGNVPPPGATIKVPIPPSLPQTPPTVSGGVTLVPTSPMLEVANIPSNIFSLQWEWMKRYRVWEANRKIFLFPENWLEPEFRDDKTHLFAELEGALLQGDVFSLLAVAPPQAPTNLQGEVKDCKVKLLWEDNAANESGYEVWMAAPGAPLTLLATLQPASLFEYSAGGVTWFEFQAPGPGYFLFWVEAVNAIGQQGSNIIYLNVDAGCPAGAATHLQVEILDIAVSGSAERVYCYVSFENAPEVRMPAQDGDFIAVQSGHGDLAPWPHTFALSIPQDNLLDVSGECWGWAGNNLSKLGTFTASLGSETWDGAPRLVHGGVFDLSLSVLPQGMGRTRMMYINDTKLPEVRNFRLEYEVDNNICKLGCWWLRWDFAPPMGWKGYFNIYWYVTKPYAMDRQLGRDVAPQSRMMVLSAGDGREEALVNLFGCDRNVMFRIAAYHPGPHGSGTAGVTSDFFYHSMPQCQSFVKVKFDTLELPWTGDGAFAGPCDKIEVYYTLLVNGVKKNFWGGCSFGVGCFLKPLQCGTYSFKDLASPTSDSHPDEIWAAIYTEDVNLKIMTLFHDYDSSSGDDLFAPYVLYHSWPTRAQAEAELGHNGKSFSTDMYENDTAASILHYTISIFRYDPYKYSP